MLVEVYPGISGCITPPPDNGNDGGSVDGCPTDSSLSSVNNSTPNSSPFPPSPASSIRRRNRSTGQREANRSKQFTNRLQRSATITNTDELGRKKPRAFRRNTNSLPVDHGLKALEPLHDPSLVKMAYAEQQQWITVQQKTFTKWYVGIRNSRCGFR